MLRRVTFATRGFHENNDENKMHWNREWIYMWTYMYGMFYKILILVDLYIYIILFKPLYLLQGLRYVQIYLGAPHNHSADATRSDTSCGPTPPHPQAAAPKSPQIRSVRREVQSPWNCSVCQPPSHPLRRYRCAKSMHIFPVVLRQSFWHTTSNWMHGEIIGANQAGNVH